MVSKEGIKIIYAYFINSVSPFVRNVRIITHINKHTHTHTYISRCIKVLGLMLKNVQYFIKVNKEWIDLKDIRNIVDDLARV